MAALIGANRKNPSGYDDDPAFKLMTPRNALFMEPREVTTAEVLKKAGYATGHVGKWHLGPDEFLPAGQGFDSNAGGADIGHTGSYFDPYLNEGAPIPSLAPRLEGEYLTDRLSDEACDFIRANKDRPFFLNLCHYAVHAPLQAKDVDVARFREKPVVDGQKDPVYAAMIKSVDDSVGPGHGCPGRAGSQRTDLRLLLLRQRRPPHGHRQRAAPDGEGVPLRRRHPGGPDRLLAGDDPGPAPTPGSVSSIDFFPTILSLAGLGLPRGRTIDGVDFSASSRE